LGQKETLHLKSDLEGMIRFCVQRNARLKYTILSFVQGNFVVLLPPVIAKNPFKLDGCVLSALCDGG
ncbi:MAG: hypothetical protein ACRC7P_09850, partial [Enterovibrio sp.]